jgi:hypothetical protein
MDEAAPQVTDGSREEELVYFRRAEGSRVPFNVYSSPELYQLEQERIFRGPVWSFVAMEAEIPRPVPFVDSPREKNLIWLEPREERRQEKDCNWTMYRTEAKHSQRLLYQPGDRAVVVIETEGAYTSWSASAYRWGSPF